MDTLHQIKRDRYSKIENLPAPSADICADKTIATLDDMWERERLNKKPSLLNAIWKLYKPIVKTKLYYIAFVLTLRLSTLLTLSYIMRAITSKDLGENITMGSLVRLAVVYAILELIVRIMLSNFLNLNQILACNFRQTLQGFLYKKIHSSSLTSLKQLNIGKVINLLGNNLNDLDSSFPFLLPGMISPFVIIISMYFLWSSYQSYCLITLTIMVTLMYVSNKMSHWT
jgi:hypothetical protein